MQIQCRISDEECRGQLIHALAARIQSEFGVTAAIDLLPPHSIPRTSSGKPARAEAKKRYQKAGNDSNLLIVFYVQIMPDDFVMQLHRF